MPELWADDADVGALPLEAIRDEPPSPTRVALGDVEDLIRSLHGVAPTARGAVLVPRVRRAARCRAGRGPARRVEALLDLAP